MINIIMVLMLFKLVWYIF